MDHIPVVAREPGSPAGMVPEGKQVAHAVGEDALLEGLDVVQVSETVDGIHSNVILFIRGVLTALSLYTLLFMYSLNMLIYCSLGRQLFIANITLKGFNI